MTFQQVQKYEKGVNRISASKLAAAAEALGVTPGFFFGEEDVLPKIYDEISKLIGMLDSSEAFELNSHFVKIRDPKVRGKVISLFKAIAAQEGVETD